MFDFLIVGAGFAGAVMAERIATQLNKKVLVIEKRNHIGGNCYDYRDESGIIVHKYGPHIFHTDYKEVFNYLSNFTDWQMYQHRVLGYIDGKKVPIPFNFESMDTLFPSTLSRRIQEKLTNAYEYGSRVPILELLNSSDQDVESIAKFVYEKVFLNYTTKQWGRRPEEIDVSVTSRVPVVLSRDNRYFTDKYQAIPTEGYTKIFERMLNHPNIKILLNTDFREVVSLDMESKKVYFLSQEFKGRLIFTGMLDELFGYKFGVLPYRSLNFVFSRLNKDYYQEAATVNYPNDYDFTRITEFKHIHPADTGRTVIVYEFPEEYRLGKIPYYPVFTQDAKEMYNKYRELTEEYENIVLIGRLAEYRYYDMDDIVKRALDLFNYNF